MEKNIVEEMAGVLVMATILINYTGDILDHFP